MKKKVNWPEAIRDIVALFVIGWIICSIASCTTKSKQAEFHMMENLKGTVVW